MKDKEIDDVKKKLKPTKKEPVRTKDLLSTGSTLLNLACSGKSTGGILKGTYSLFVGDSDSGKSFLSLTCLAEAAINPEFDEYRFIYDNSENGVLMDMERFFGKELVKRLEPPAIWIEEPVFSTTTEEFYYHVDDAIREDKPFIYVLDSMDSLDTEDDRSKFDETKQASRKGKEASGSYGASKAKMNSSNIRRLVHALRKTKSILIIINQSRDNLGFGAQFNPKIRSGGRAMVFYATLQVWYAAKGKISKTVRGKSRKLGIISSVHVKRSRLTGKDRTIEIPIYHSAGIDNTGSCIDYLVEEGHWNKSGSKINAKEFNVSLKREELAAHIEDNDLETELRSIVADVWGDIEAACSIKRKRRYN